MRQKDFGSTGVKVSEIGYGGWSIGEAQWGSPPTRASADALRAALEMGVTFFDTAQEYGQGTSEETFGEVLGGVEGIFVTTKTGKYWADGKFHTDYSPGFIVSSAEESLRRLKRDRIDLYLLHDPGAKVSARPETWQALRKLQAGGKIRVYGSSLSTTDELRGAIDNGCAAVELMVHMAETAELAMAKVAADAALAVIGRTPMGWGALSGKYEPGFTLSETDFRSPGHWGHQNFTTWVDRAQQLRFLEGPDQTLGQAAIRYVLAQKEISVAIPGGKTPEQVAQNVGSGERALSAEELEKIAEVQKTWG